MSLIRIKDKYQITIPADLRDQLGLNADDFLEASIENDKITLTPMRVVNRENSGDPISPAPSSAPQPAV
jgi:AbrB family looped-hinge helix DNA binding protein